MWMSTDIAIGICAYLDKESLESSRLASKTFHAVVKRHFLHNIPNICSKLLRITFNADDTVNCYIVFRHENDNIPRYFEKYRNKERIQSFLFTLPSCNMDQIPSVHIILRLFNSGKINFEVAAFEAQECQSRSFYSFILGWEHLWTNAERCCFKCNYTQVFDDNDNILKDYLKTHSIFPKTNWTENFHSIYHHKQIAITSNNNFFKSLYFLLCLEEVDLNVSLNLTIPKHRFQIFYENLAKLIRKAAELFRTKEKPVIWRMNLNWNDKNLRRNPTKYFEVENSNTCQKLCIKHKMEKSITGDYYPPSLLIIVYNK
ncbi:hypothetical protein Ddc_12089 [Ditylenchus destructor]|nr:hypothetical protein Ddc_12089 [Ditylenchus destructor]